MPYRLSNRSYRELVGVHPYLGFLAQEAIAITPVDFLVFDGIRTLEEQQALVSAGASKTLKSYHLYGLAVDLVPWINGAPRWEHEPMDRIHDACVTIIQAHGLPIDNGHDLWGWDKPHWQMSGWKDKYDARELI